MTDSRCCADPNGVLEVAPYARLSRRDVGSGVLEGVHIYCRRPRPVTVELKSRKPGHRKLRDDILTPPPAVELLGSLDRAERKLPATVAPHSAPTEGRAHGC